MSVRRLLMLLLLVTGMLALPFPASAGPRIDAAFVRATNADRREVGLSRWPPRPPWPGWPGRTRWPWPAGPPAATGAAVTRALWHNDISKASDHWVWLGQNVGCGSLGSDGLTASVRRVQNALHGLERSPAQHPLPQGQPVRRGDLGQGRRHLGHGQLRADHARLGLIRAYPLTGRRWRWHDRRALSWAASSVGRAPGF